MPLDPSLLVRATGISKKFYSPDASGRGRALKDILLATFFLKNSRRADETGIDKVLKNVSFVIRRGESVLLTGPIDTGKTTILNLICGICRPDEGALDVFGKASILSCNSTLFHSRRSMSQNIFLMASVFGLSGSETQKRLGSILDLSGPIPESPETIGLRSHHGAWMKLAISILLHADLDLYLIDETLLGEEPSFLERCGQKCADLKKKGRSILAITHEPQNLKKYFDRTLRLEAGTLTEVSV
jgi:ABC-type polysaccharide/polyol phosphate transport system ATPase subunit